jgi:hypothetical protein
MSAVGTFIYEFSTPRANNEAVQHFFPAFETAPIGRAEATITGSIQSFVFSNKAFIVLAWLIGTVLLSIRLCAGWSYTVMLRAGATLLRNDWSRRLHELGAVMGINKLVSLAESNSLDSPVVMRRSTRPAAQDRPPPPR